MTFVSGATPTPEPPPSDKDATPENDDAATDERTADDRPARSAPTSVLSRRDLVLITAASLVIALVVAVAVVALTRGDADDGTVSVEEFLDQKAPAQSEGAEVGESVPNLDLNMFDGTTTTLGDLIDRPTVINVWASTCAPCLREMPDFEAVHDDLGDRVAMLGIDSGETKAQGAPFAARVGVTYPLAEDPDQSHSVALGLVALPMTLFVEADGTVAGQQLGAMDEAELRSNIERYLDVAS